MAQSQNTNIQEENDIKKIADLIFKNYKLFIASIIIALGLAYLLNRYSIPIYKISSSLLVKEETKKPGGNVTDYLNSNLFSVNQNFQNELWVLKSAPVVEQTIKNLNLSVSYFHKENFQYHDVYKKSPFLIVFRPDHIQPIDVRFQISFTNNEYFKIEAEANDVSFYNFEKNEVIYQKKKWNFKQSGKIGELISTDDLEFIVQIDSTHKFLDNDLLNYQFEFNSTASLVNSWKNEFKFNIVDKMATVVEISLKAENVQKGVDLVNELMFVSSSQNLERKNHLASVTVDYVEKQLNEISDSLNQTENNLQTFRSANQLLNITEQANNISTQYIDLQNQLAALDARKK